MSADVRAQARAVRRGGGGVVRAARRGRARGSRRIRRARSISTRSIRCRARATGSAPPTTAPTCSACCCSARAWPASSRCARCCSRSRSARSLGALAGYRGGRTDHLITGLADLVQAFPAVVLNIAILALVSRPGVLHVVLALSANGWVLFARIARAQTLAFARERLRRRRAPARRIRGAHPVESHRAEHRERAARAGDLGARRGGAGGIHAVVSGPRTGRDGVVGRAARSGQRRPLRFPHVALIAGSTIALTVLGFNLAGDFVRDRLDPRLRERSRGKKFQPPRRHLRSKCLFLKHARARAIEQRVQLRERS